MVATAALSILSVLEEPPPKNGKLAIASMILDKALPTFSATCAMILKDVTSTSPTILAITFKIGVSERTTGKTPSKKTVFVDSKTDFKIGVANSTALFTASKPFFYALSATYKIHKAI